MKFVFSGVVIVAIAVCGVVWLGLAFVSPLDYWDGFNFLLQSRRLTDPLYEGVTFDAWRPRGLVAMLAGLDWMSLRFWQEFPTVPIYHAYMALVTVAFLLVWNQVNAKLWGRNAALLSTVFLLVSDLLHHYATSLLGDITTGLFWGACCLAFLVRPDEKISPARAVAIGVLGALSGMSKYHFLLLLPLLVLFWVLAAARDRWRSGLAMLLGFLVSLEAGLRIFSKNDAGMWGHAGHLWRQVGVAATLKRPTDIYFDGLYHMYGPIFWTLALLAAVRLRGKVDVGPRGKAALWSGLCLAILTQSITQRELRYLFPLLPMLLGLVAWGMLKNLERMPSAARIAWVGLWAFALFYPALRSWRDLRVSFRGPTYQVARLDSEAYWAYFGLPSLVGNRCHKIDACIFSLATREWEYPKDQFYRAFDLGPQYQYFTRLPTTMKTCPNNPATLGSLVETDTCYVQPFQDAREIRPYVAVVKYLGSGWTEQQKKFLLTQSAHPREGIHCEGNGCWSVAPFFRELPGQN